MRTLSSAILAAFALVLALGLSSAPARADRKNQDCEAGEYLVGFHGRAGVGVDRLGAMCASWDAGSGKLGPAHESDLVMLGLSHGGRPLTKVCPPNSAIGRIDYFIPTINGEQIAENLRIQCFSMEPDHRNAGYIEFRTEGSGRSDDGQLVSAPLAICRKPGEIARGFAATTGTYVGLIDLRCVSFPKIGSIFGDGTTPPPPPPPTPITLQAGDSIPLGAHDGRRLVAECGAGQALAGIDTSGHNQLESITAWCADIVGGGWSGVPDARGSIGSETPDAGFAHTVCNPGDWVVGARALVSNAPTPILGFAAICSNGRQAQQWAGHQHVPSNAPAAQSAVSCGPGKIAVGIYGYTTPDRLLHGFGLRCADRATRLASGSSGSSGTTNNGFAGTWLMHLADGYTYTMTLYNQGGSIGGTYDVGRRNGTISNANVNGNTVTFTWSQNGTIKGSGTGSFHLDGPDSLSGTWTFGAFSGTWSGTRQ